MKRSLDTTTRTGGETRRPQLLQDVLQSTLQGNLKLQQSLRSQLQKVAKRKARNRKCAARYYQEKSAPPVPRDDLPKSAIKLIYRKPNRSFFSNSRAKDPVPTLMTTKEVNERKDQLRKRLENFTTEDENLPAHLQQQQDFDVTWTPAQDELLLKYLVVAGVERWPVDELTTIQRVLFPRKRLISIRDRIVHLRALTAPGYNVSWTVPEERRIVILQKIYQDDLPAVSTHFPHRSARAVSEKWHRTLSPAYSTAAWTKTEDAALLKVTREDPDVGWAAVASQLPTRRHPQRVWNRWVEIATTEDMERKRSGNNH